MEADRSLPVLPPIKGRGTAQNPPNRFVPLAFEPDAAALDEGPAPRTQFYRDTTRTAITRNNSPDVGFDFSVNPYRGCEHGCIYCYARPTHEYFGLSAGLDFETRIFVKEDAPELLRRELSSPRWRPATIAISGVTDPYQPVERRLEITRRCLRVLADFRNPVSVITKNQLVTRDVDIFSEMAADSAASVNVSVTTLDPALQRLMEPRTSNPANRLRAISTLADAGVPVGVMVAPVIPGLTDHELPGILEAAYEAGARTAGYISLRLPHAVATLFEEWLAAHFPDRKSRVLGRIRGVRNGKLNDPRFGSRMRGEGEYAEQIRALFEVSCAKLGFNRERKRLSVAAWRGPVGAAAATGRAAGQLTLF
jgi:DNA repair photolyase